MALREVASGVKFSEKSLSPTEQEIKTNNRARSAKLRVAQKI
jgi:16S rRNA C1402 N4-methylase RsmH